MRMMHHLVGDSAAECSRRYSLILHLRSRFTDRSSKETLRLGALITQDKEPDLRTSTVFERYQKQKSSSSRVSVQATRTASSQARDLVKEHVATEELENALKHVGVGEEERQQIMHEIPTGWGNEGGVGDLRQGIDATPQHQIRVFHNVFVLQNLYVATGFVTMVNVMSEEYGAGWVIMYTIYMMLPIIAITFTVMAMLKHVTFTAGVLHMSSNAIAEVLARQGEGRLLLREMAMRFSQNGFLGGDTVPKVFENMDVDGDGQVTQEEFTKGLNAFGLYLTYSQTDSVLRVIDRDHSGNVDIKEFVTALLKSLTHKELGNEDLLLSRPSQPKPAEDVGPCGRVCGTSAQANEEQHQEESDPLRQITLTDFVRVEADTESSIPKLSVSPGALQKEISSPFNACISGQGREECSRKCKL